MTTDVTILGAGPAGSIAAILLARGGINVTLAEQHRFPRDKVCGECLSALGISVLCRSGLAGIVLSAGAVDLTHVAMHPRDGDSLVLELPEIMWGISRCALDSLLIDAARDA